MGATAGSSKTWVDANKVLGFVTSGLQLRLDASNASSYPGTGTTWFDLSGNGYNFTINAGAFVSNGQASHMNFETATTGAAKRVVGGVLTNVPAFANSTFMIFSTVRTLVGDWRTLIRGSTAGPDHQVIIENTSDKLGMYDNQLAGYIYSGYDINWLDKYNTQFNALTWKFGQTSPYYQFYSNANIVPEGIMTNANATYNNGFATIGNYHGESIDPLAGSQFWGKIALVLYYDRYLSDAEIKQNFAFFRSRFSLA
jgi:hypothetical protein